MKYTKTLQAEFIDRPNRFIAHVKLNGQIETVHVKNTGRCRELLIPGVRVILEEPENKNRKTKYDLIAVYKEGFGLINIDSQAPNKVAKEWLMKKGYDLIKPEYTYGNSRIDFYMEKNICDSSINETNCNDSSINETNCNDSSINETNCNYSSINETNCIYSSIDESNCIYSSIDKNTICDSSLEGERDSEMRNTVEEEIEKYLMEVKGCTLEKDGIGYFPDAPTERGVKHIYELIKAKKEGYHAALAFVIQMEGIDEVRPNVEMQPEFGKAIEDAIYAGIDILYIKCIVREDELVCVE